MRPKILQSIVYFLNQSIFKVNDGNGSLDSLDKSNVIKICIHNLLVYMEYVLSLNFD